MSNDRDFHGLGDEFDPENEDLEDFDTDDSVSIIRIQGKKKFLDWVKDTYENMDSPIELEDDEILNHVESFHVPSFMNDENIEDFFTEFGKDVFHFMFAKYIRNKDFFPAYSDRNSLEEWFHIQIDGYIQSFEEVLDFLDEIDGKVL
ncbi:MAG: hypothetical protein H7A25_19120 [Leptospiraceae bacterium]|nr:hypothetical protein [Leptospiraceae bacterium]